MTAKKRPVIATGCHDGRVVMYGWTTQRRPDQAGGITLDMAQLCVRWTGHGLGEMAATGPGPSCRIGPAVPRVWMADVRSITDVQPEAVGRWEAAPWGI